MSRGRILGATSVVAVALLGFGATAWSASLTLTTRHKATLGEFLTNGHGRTMYMFTADHGKGSACTDACAKAWPPVLTSNGAIMPGDAVNASEMGTISHGKSKKVGQVTYNGMPLYYFVRDKHAGSVAGEGIKHFGGSWYVVSPKGEPILPDGKTMKHG